MRTQFKFTLRLICTPEYKYTPEYIYTRVFFAHANWTLVLIAQVISISVLNITKSTCSNRSQIDQQRFDISLFIFFFVLVDNYEIVLETNNFA